MISRTLASTLTEIPSIYVALTTHPTKTFTGHPLIDAIRT